MKFNREFKNSDKISKKNDDNEQLQKQEEHLKHKEINNKDSELSNMELEDKSNLFQIILKFITFGLLTGLIIFWLLSETEIIGLMGLSLLFVPLLIIGHIRNDKVYNIFGYIYLFYDVVFLLGIWSFLNAEIGILECFCILIVLIFSWIWMFVKKQYSSWCKMLNYVIFLLVIIKPLLIQGIVLGYTIVVILNIIAYNSALICDWRKIKTIKKDNNNVEPMSRNVCHVINIILLIFGIWALLMGSFDFNIVSFIFSVGVIATLCFEPIIIKTIIKNKQK